MNAKLIASLILGLVFQIAQMLPAAVVTSVCRGDLASCACCEPGDSCPCASNCESQDRKPAPAIPENGASQKVPAARPGHPPIIAADAVIRDDDPGIRMAPRAGPHPGYSGVALSVSFCSFVI